jgi:hypothetical protein
VQGKLGIDFPQQFFQPVHDDAVPGDEARPAMHVHAGEMRVLVDVLLLVPIGHAIREELRGIELDDRLDEAISLRRIDQRYVSADAVTERHGCLPDMR